MKEGEGFISAADKGHRLEGCTMCPVQRTYYFQLTLNYRENYMGVTIHQQKTFTL